MRSTGAGLDLHNAARNKIPLYVSGTGDIRRVNVYPPLLSIQLSRSIDSLAKDVINHIKVDTLRRESTETNNELLQ